MIHLARSNEGDPYPVLFQNDFEAGPKRFAEIVDQQPVARPANGAEQRQLKLHDELGRRAVGGESDTMPAGWTTSP